MIVDVRCFIYCADTSRCGSCHRVWRHVVVLCSSLVLFCVGHVAHLTGYSILCLRSWWQSVCAFSWSPTTGSQVRGDDCKIYFWSHAALRRYVIIDVAGRTQSGWDCGWCRGRSLQTLPKQFQHHQEQLYFMSKSYQFNTDGKNTQTTTWQPTSSSGSLLRTSARPTGSVWSLGTWDANQKTTHNIVTTNIILRFLAPNLWTQPAGSVRSLGIWDTKRKAIATNVIVRFLAPNLRAHQDGSVRSLETSRTSWHCHHHELPSTSCRGACNVRAHDASNMFFLQKRAGCSDFRGPAHPGDRILRRTRTASRSNLRRSQVLLSVCFALSSVHPGVSRDSEVHMRWRYCSIPAHKNIVQITLRIGCLLVTQSAECVFVCSWTKFASGVVVVSFVHLGYWVTFLRLCGVVSLRACAQSHFSVGAHRYVRSVWAVLPWHATSLAWLNSFTAHRDVSETIRCILTRIDCSLSPRISHRMKQTEMREQLLSYPRSNFQERCLNIFMCEQIDHLKIASFSFHHRVGFSRHGVLHVFVVLLLYSELQFQIPHSSAWRLSGRDVHTELPLGCRTDSCCCLGNTLLIMFSKSCGAHQSLPLIVEVEMQLQFGADTCQNTGCRWGKTYISDKALEECAMARPHLLLNNCQRHRKPLPRKMLSWKRRKNDDRECLETVRMRAQWTCVCAGLRTGEGGGLRYVGPIKQCLISNTVAFSSEIGGPVGTAWDSTPLLQDVASMVCAFALGTRCLAPSWPKLANMTACCFWRCALRRIWSVFAQLNATRSRPKQTHCVLRNILREQTGKVQNIGSYGCCLFCHL